MYELLKRVSKFLLPKQYLYTFEDPLRRVVSSFYRGQNHECNICNTRLRTFINIHDNDLLCPRCGSLSRTRRLYKELTDHSTLKGRVLHFSPSRALYDRFKKLKNIRYVASDYENEFLADYKMDITNLNCDDDYFDLILCLHVLEHVYEDKKAISELYRVLKPGGVCYLQTPFKTGTVYEDERIISPKERALAFGQHDHVRIYSVDGLEQRLKEGGFVTSTQNFEEEEYYGLKQEFMIKASKT